MHQFPISNVFIKDAAGEQTNDEMGCPYYDSLKERLLSGVLLYQKRFDGSGAEAGMG